MSGPDPTSPPRTDHEPVEAASDDAAGAGDSRLSVFLRFLRIGLVAWGGPAAQTQILYRECVEEEEWVSPSSFRKTLAVYQVLPGPEVTELCI